MATIHDAVAELRQRYSTYTRAQLQTVLHSWQPHDPHYIAAKTLLDEMDSALSDTKHRESLNEARQANKEARQANNLAKWAILIASLALLASVADFAYKSFFSPVKDEFQSQKHLNKEPIKPTTISSFQNNEKVPSTKIPPTEIVGFTLLGADD